MSIGLVARREKTLCTDTTSPMIIVKNKNITELTKKLQTTETRNKIYMIVIHQ